jgi:hypothetical protein
MKKVSLTESDLTRIIKNIVNEQETGGTQSFRDLYNAIVYFHPELKDMSPNVGRALEHIFEDGKFNMGNMKEVCKDKPEFCKVAFTTPEVMNELFKVIG